MGLSSPPPPKLGDYLQAMFGRQMGIMRRMAGGRDAREEARETPNYLAQRERPGFNETFQRMEGRDDAPQLATGPQPEGLGTAMARGLYGYGQDFMADPIGSGVKLGQAIQRDPLGFMPDPRVGHQLTMDGHPILGTAMMGLDVADILTPGLPLAGMVGSVVRRGGREIAESATESALRGAAKLDNSGAVVNMSEAARALDTPASTVRAARPAEGIKGVRTAGTQGRGIGSIRELPQAEATRQAQRGAHVVRGTDGQYVGAPRGMNTPGGLRALRRRLDNLATEGEVGRDWYDRTEAGNLEIAGPHADKTALASAEQGLWSAGANPDVNLGFQIGGHNAYEAGAPELVGRWPSTQGARYIDARDAGGVPDLGPKTGVYGGHLDPFVESPITGTNDIWHARAFGYTNSDGSTFSRGLSPQEHAFMDAETLLSAERVNAARGTDIWDGRGSQAAIWVRMKGQDLAERGGLTLEEGMAEARKSYPEYLEKYTANATHEAVPGVDTGHLPGIQDASPAERQAYTDAVPWTTEAGNDALYGELGMYNQHTAEGTGYFGGDTNPVRVARPLVERSAAEGVGPRSRAILNATEATRGLLDGQNAAAWHHTRPDAKAGDATSAFIGLNRAADPEEMSALAGLSDKHFPVDTGNGVTLMADPDAAVNSRDVLKSMQGPWGDAIRGTNVRHGEDLLSYIPGAEGMERVGVDGSYQSLLEMEGAAPGGGVVTDEVLRLVAEADALAPTTSTRLSAPSIRNRAGLLAQRDDLLAGKYGGVRDDLQNFRRIFAEEGLIGLQRARDSGVALPALGALVGAHLLRGQGERR